MHRLELYRVDRAQTEDERDGFLKLVSRAGGRLVGATVVSRAAGETINELALAVDKGLSVSDLASAIHVYPTFVSPSSSWPRRRLSKRLPQASEAEHCAPCAASPDLDRE